MRSSRPSTTSPGEPRVKRAPPRTSVPLAGFLSLSVVSQQARVPRPCFMPQPFVIADLQGVPLAPIAAPLEAASSPAVLHRRAAPRRPRPDPPAVSLDARARRRSGRAPPRARGPFPQARAPASRSLSTLGGGTVAFRQLRRLRSVPPAASPFTPIRANPDQRSLPSWPSAPPEFCPRASEPG
jgi:hypothetical protein